jgi:hypothetical protein
MTSVERRIEKLEKQLMPQPLTPFYRQLIVRMDAGRERVRKMQTERGLAPVSDWGLPPKKVFTSRGIQRTMDILNEGRDRSALRSMRDRKLRESMPPAEGGA